MQQTVTVYPGSVQRKFIDCGNIECMELAMHNGKKLLGTWGVKLHALQARSDIHVAHGLVSTDEPCTHVRAC